MTLPVVGQTSAAYSVPYLSIDMFRHHARRGVATNSLVIDGDQADQDAALADYIAQATSKIDSYLLGTLASTLDTEVGPVMVNRQGYAIVVPRYRPIVALTAFAGGPNIAQLTEFGDLSGASVESGRILVPVGPYGTWSTNQGPLQLGRAAPIPGELYARWTTCNGYPVTWLTESVDTGGLVLPVADTTGIVAGRTPLTLQAGRYRQRFVPTAVSTADASGLGTGPGTITLPSGLMQPADNRAAYPTYVTGLPDDVIAAAVLMTRGLIKLTAGGNISGSSQATKIKDPEGAGDDIARAYEMIDQYQMVQR